MPETLMATIVQAIMSGAAGQTAAAGAVSTRAATVAEGVVRTMLMTKLKIVMGLLLALGLIGLGAGLLTSETLSARPKDDAAKPGPYGCKAPFRPRTRSTCRRRG
jgi:hypothetical protein